jgi:hypothetical protein
MRICDEATGRRGEKDKVLSRPFSLPPHHPVAPSQSTNSRFIDTQHAAICIQRGHYAQGQCEISDWTVAAG